MDNIIIYRMRFRVTQIFSVVMYRDSVHSDQHSHAHSSKIFIMVTTSFVPRPSDWGRGKEGLVSTVCTCAVIQILNNPITYGYRLYTFMDTFTIKYMKNVAHAHAMDTRPSLPSPQSEGLGTRLHS